MLACIAWGGRPGRWIAGMESGIFELQTEGAALHALAGAAAIEVDLVVTALLAHHGATRQIGRLAATELQGHQVLLFVKPQVLGRVAVDQRTGGQHLGVKQGVAREQPVEIAAMAIGPAHHGGDGQTPGRNRSRHASIIPARTKKPAEAGFVRPAEGDQPMCRPPFTEKSAPVA